MRFEPWNEQGRSALAVMQLTEDILCADLAVLSHGGQEAISLFLEMSRRLHEAGDAEALRDWVVIAAPALPEKERGEIIVLLMYGYLYLSYQTKADIGTRH
jgi:hypothetical protein